MKSLSTYTAQRKADGSKTLVTYVTAGLGDWTSCIQACIDNGADIIEVGLPFSDPIMDGPVIARASAHALASGADTKKLLAELGQAKFDVPVAVMTYANVLFSHGIENIMGDLSASQVTGLIIPDVTFEQRELFTSVLDSTDIAFIPLISSTTSEHRRKNIIGSAEGFLYCVAIKGITGQGQQIETDFISTVQKQSNLPVFTGVGVRTPDDAFCVAPYCDGVIVGTSIVERMFDRNPAESIGQLVSDFRQAIDKVDA